MTKPCIISVAITGSLPQKANNPAVPVTPSEQIESTHEAFEAGATLVHLHVRNDDGTPSSNPERFAEVQDGIRKHCPGMIIQFSTGGRSGAGNERGGMLHLKPDMASLATGSVNFGPIIYGNSAALIDDLAERMLKYDIKPEIEAFDLSMVFNTAKLVERGLIKAPVHLQFVMSIPNAIPANREVLEFMIRQYEKVCPGGTWTAAGIGKYQLELNKWALELGGHVRTGLEDNVRFDKNTLAKSNAHLVERLAGMVIEHDRTVATPAEARALLGLRPA